MVYGHAFIYYISGGDYGNRNIQGCRLCPMESHTCHNIDNTIRYTHSLHLHSINSMSTHLLHSSLLGLNSALIVIRGLFYPGRSSEGRSLGGWAYSWSGVFIPRWPWMSSSSIFGKVLSLELLVLLRM